LSCHHQVAKKKKLTIVHFSNKFLEYSQTRDYVLWDMCSIPDISVIVQWVICAGLAMYKAQC
jgi:hypothetical protein